MKLKIAALLAALGVAQAAYSYESLLGVITSTGSTVNNSTTGTTFTIPASATQVAIQCDAAACIHVGSGSSTAASCSASSANLGVLVAAGQLYDVPLAHVGNNAVDTIAVISVSGTVNCATYNVISGP